MMLISVGAAQHKPTTIWSRGQRPSRRRHRRTCIQPNWIRTS